MIFPGKVLLVFVSVSVFIISLTYPEGLLSESL